MLGIDSSLAIQGNLSVTEKKRDRTVGLSIDKRDPKFIEALMPYWEWFYRYYFRVQTDGWENIPTNGKALLVGSHNGGIASPDMVMMMYDWFRHFGTQRPVYGLMHSSVWKVNPIVAKIAEKTGAIVAKPQMAIAAFNKGASVLVYPGGAKDLFRPHYDRGRINFANNKSFIKLALRMEVPIVPMISNGAHDTLIILGDIYPFMETLNQWGLPWLYGVDPEVFPIYLGLPWGIGFGPLPNIPLPVPIRTRVCKPIVFDRYGKEAARDRAYVDTCYETVVTQMQEELDNLIEKNS
jgi:1-acyl-sn-glycerol-3-phosphate acyltransferase